jgi:hypothetical protein
MIIARFYGEASDRAHPLTSPGLTDMLVLNKYDYPVNQSIRRIPCQPLPPKKPDP